MTYPIISHQRTAGLTSSRTLCNCV